LQFYPAGSWGPAAADKLLKPYAKEWYKLDAHPKVVHILAGIE
jgi:hypothetical protein